MSAVTPELLRRYDVPGPRYTSYPTADRFVEAFGAATECGIGRAPQDATEDIFRTHVAVAAPA